MNVLAKLKKIRIEFVLIAIVLIYLISPIKALSFQHDALIYLNQVKNNLLQPGLDLTHPHHFLTSYVYVFIARGLAFFFPFLSLEQVSIFAMRYGNIVFSILSLTSVILLCKTCFRFKKSTQIWILCASAFSMLSWSYSSSAELYQPALCAFMFALYSLFRRPVKLGAVLLTSLLSVLAICLHIMAGIVVPGALFFYWKKREVPFLFTYLVTTFLGCLFVYWLKFLSFSTIQEAVAWFLPGPGSGDFNVLRMLLYFLIGFGRSIMGVYFLFGNSRFYAVVSEKIFPLQYFLDDRFLVRDLSVVMWATLLLFVLVLGVVFVGLLAKSVGDIVTNKIKSEAGPAIVSLLVMFLFGLVLAIVNRDLYNADMYVLMLYVFWIVFAFGLDGFTSKKWAWIFLVGMILVNYVGAVRFLSHQQNDLFYVAAMKVNAELKADDAVIVELKRNYRPYFDFYNVAGRAYYLSDKGSLSTIGPESYILSTVYQTRGYMQRRYPFDEKNQARLTELTLKRIEVF